MSKKITEDTSNDTKVNDTPPTPKIMCGVIMPIANTSGYELGHWKDVLNIIEDALLDSDFEAKLVSERIDIGLIHEQIVTNIYENEIVICDVSAKNPNVMFELGMRLAFDKPTIIIKDEKTDYSFDIGGILHIEYPSSLRHNKIEIFKNELRKHVIASHEKAKSEKDYSPFLKSFAKKLLPKTLNQQEATANQIILDKLDWIAKNVQDADKNASSRRLNQINGRINRPITLNGKEIKPEIITFLKQQFPIEELKLAAHGDQDRLTRMSEIIQMRFGNNYHPSEIRFVILNILDSDYF